MEASGTSGMKAAMNGVLNLSILDGWWAEGYASDVGFAIGWNENLGDGASRDRLDADLLYQTLEQKVIPTFYSRDDQDVPRNWVYMMKASITKLGTEYSTNRMVREYMEKFYAKAGAIHQAMVKDGCRQLKDYHVWHNHLIQNWSDIQFLEIEHPDADLLRRSEEVRLGVRVSLGKIKPEQVKVEVFYGSLDDYGNFSSGKGQVMDLNSTDGNQAFFRKTISFSNGGKCGYQFRVLPKHAYMASDIIPNLIAWS